MVSKDETRKTNVRLNPTCICIFHQDGNFGLPAAQILPLLQGLWSPDTQYTNTKWTTAPPLYTSLFLQVGAIPARNTLIPSEQQYPRSSRTCFTNGHYICPNYLKHQVNNNTPVVCELVLTNRVLYMPYRLCRLCAQPDCPRFGPLAVPLLGWCGVGDRNTTSKPCLHIFQVLAEGMMIWTHPEPHL